MRRLAPRSRLLRRNAPSRLAVGPTRHVFCTDDVLWMGPGWSSSIKGFSISSVHLCLAAENDSLKNFCEIEDNIMKQSALSPEKGTVVKQYEPLHLKGNHGSFVVPFSWKFGVKALRKLRTHREERLNRLHRSLRIGNRAFQPAVC